MEPGGLRSTGKAEAIGLEVDAMVAAVFCPEAIPGIGPPGPATVTEAPEWRMTARQATSAPAESSGHDVEECVLGDRSQ